MERPREKSITAESKLASEAVKLAIGLLEQDFNLRKVASAAFPPEITSSYIRHSIRIYEDEISAAAKRSACCCCGKLVSAKDMYKVDGDGNGDGDFILPLRECLDSCGRQGSL